MRRLAILVFLAAGPALAQQSASFELDEHTLNGGGHPSAGTVPASAGFRITQGSIGDPVVAHGMAGGSFRVDASFLSAYPPPWEVTGLGFAANKQDLFWQSERSRGTYSLYRGSLGSLSGLGYGTCLQQDIASESTNDLDTPPGGDGFFYLVTVENRLGEEGTKGTRSDGTTERQGTRCP